MLPASKLEGERLAKLALSRPGHFVFAWSILFYLAAYNSLGLYMDDYFCFNTVERSGGGVQIFESYRPLGWLYFSILNQMKHIGVLRLISIILFAFANLFLFMLFKRLMDTRAALLASLLFAAAPHFNTLRFMIIASHATLALILFLLGAIFLVDAESGSTPRRHIVVGSGLIVLSGLSYEIFLPQIFVIVCWFYGQRFLSSEAGQRNLSLGAKVFASTSAVVIGLGLFKRMTTERFLSESQSMGLSGLGGHLYYYGSALKRATIVNFWEYLLAFPKFVSDARIQTDWHDFALALIFSVCGVGYAVAFDYFSPLGATKVSRSAWFIDPSRPYLLGLLLYLSGYAFFLLTFSNTIAVSGLDDRVSVAGALGVVVLLSTVVVSLPGRPVKWLFLFYLLFFFLWTNSALAGCWAESWILQRKVLASLRQALPNPRPNTLVLLYNVPSNIGPAPVFWKGCYFQSAIQLSYHRGDVYGQKLESLEDVAPAGSDKLVLSLDRHGASRKLPLESVVTYDFASSTLTSFQNGTDEDRVGQLLALLKKNLPPTCPKPPTVYGVNLYN